MTVYNAERYIAGFIKDLIEDGLDEGQDVCHLDDEFFIDENNDHIIRPTLEEAKNVNKNFIASILTNYMHEVFITSYEKYIKVVKETEDRNIKERKRLVKSPAFIRGKNDGHEGLSSKETSHDYIKGYREGYYEYEISLEP